MDINSLKKKAEEGRKVELLKDKLINMYGEFRLICDELTPMIAKRIISKKRIFYIRI